MSEARERLKALLADLAGQGTRGGSEDVAAMLVEALDALYGHDAMLDRLRRDAHNTGNCYGVNDELKRVEEERDALKAGRGWTDEAALLEAKVELLKNRTYERRELCMLWLGYARRLEATIQRIGHTPESRIPLRRAVSAAMAEVERGPYGEQPKCLITDVYRLHGRWAHALDCKCVWAGHASEYSEHCRDWARKNPLSGEQPDCLMPTDTPPEPPSEEAIRAACEAGRKHAKAAREEMRGQPGPPSGQRYTGSEEGDDG